MQSQNQQSIKDHPDYDLADEQYLAAELTSQGYSTLEISQQLEIPISTLYRWRTTDSFRAIVHELLLEVEVSTVNQALALKPKALAALESCLDSKDSRTRLKASEFLLKLGMMGKLTG